MKMEWVTAEAWDGRKLRQAEREAVRLPAIVRLEGDVTRPAVIRDLSTHGFRADCDPIGLIGRYVWVEMPGHGTVNVRIMWGVAGRIGGKFMEPLVPGDCERLRSEYPDR